MIGDTLMRVKKNIVGCNNSESKSKYKKKIKQIFKHKTVMPSVCRFVYNV